MFGLSTKEVLASAIINSSVNNIENYKQSIIESFEILENATEEETQKIMLSIRRNYLDEVANSVINTFQVSSPKIFARIKLAMMSPSICGYEEINIDDGLIAGGLYAICYYAIKNKIAAPKDCIHLNNMQNDIIDNVITELEKEYSL